MIVEARSIEHYRDALAIEPNRLDWRCNLAALLANAGRHLEAIEQCEWILQVDGQCFSALFSSGTSLLALSRPEAAAAQLRRCAQLRPRDARVHNNLGLALVACADHDAALAAYDRALELQPDYARALNNRGLAEMGRFCHQRAIEDFDRALALQPGYRAALTNRGSALLAIGHTRAALDCTRLAFPQPEALANASAMLLELGRGAEALECSRQLWRLAPQQAEAAGICHTISQALADWSDYEARREVIITATRAARRAASPFAFLSVGDSPQDQLLCAQAHARTICSVEPLWRGERYEHDRIRVGYLSSDFKSHATAYLAAGVFESHDRERFECHALSYGTAAPHDQMRARLREAFEHYHDVDGLSVCELADCIRALEIDVLVDMKGYTDRSRIAVLALRPAPIQVHYLGYPGTLGASFVDYLIADRQVIPPAARIHYSEQVVYLPHCYQPTDNRRRISESAWTRARAGLPPHGPVLCAQHQTYKITPAIFQVWMRLLARVPEATLWLIARDPAVPARLQAEAQGCGIAPSRLCFAEHIEQSEHLARLRLADVFLDTTPVAAHTTASDALWAGVPVVALEGHSFVARVSASILRAAGLSDCVAHSLAEYETLLRHLLMQPQRLAALRLRVEHEARQSPLFDTARLARALEAAYVAMWQRHRSGLPPAPIDAGVLDESLLEPPQLRQHNA